MLRKLTMALPVLAALAVSAGAFGGVSPVIFRIEASNALGSGYFEADSSQLVPDPGTGGKSWILPGAEELASNPGNVIATLNYATLTIVEDPDNYPRIVMNFNLDCGLLNAEFHVKSALVTFPTLPAVESAARATSTFTLTDHDDGHEAALSGIPTGRGMFTADYNGMVPTGTEFANLVSYMHTDQGGTVTITGKKPNAGFQLMGQDIQSISAAYDFTLTAGDHMAGQNNFFVTPEPAAVWCALLLTGAWRRR